MALAAHVAAIRAVRLDDAPPPLALRARGALLPAILRGRQGAAARVWCVGTTTHTPHVPRPTPRGVRGGCDTARRRSTGAGAAASSSRLADRDASSRPRRVVASSRTRPRDRSFVGERAGSIARSSSGASYRPSCPLVGTSRRIGDGARSSPTPTAGSTAPRRVMTGPNVPRGAPRRLRAAAHHRQALHVQGGSRRPRVRAASRVVGRRSPAVAFHIIEGSLSSPTKRTNDRGVTVRATRGGRRRRAPRSRTCSATRAASSSCGARSSPCCRTCGTAASGG